MPRGRGHVRFFLRRRAVTAWLLVAVLLAPPTLASGTASDESLWTEFMTWVQSRLGVPGGKAADHDGFTAWLMGRIWIPGG